ncbi:DUF3684 domain-containing protein [Microdochium nivale]|nr:DUF3684 domain-containing protein [Microdochium nivale]
MDYAKLRAAALRSGEDEEAVTVDTRALIDKVLARYSGEWTTLRELIQNAADAQATTVKIKWETYPSTQVPLPTSNDRSELLKHVLTHHTLKRLVAQNNGQPFTKTDWGRLKRIAEGNPDETKIGAFGVGFYSVFADCEDPFVSSGSEAMAFYWKGNALFTRKLQLPPEECTPNTAFVLDYRNTTTTLPNLLSVSQFLATSLTFVALERIEFWIDDYQILGLDKKASPSSDVALSRDVETTTKERLMKIQSVSRYSAQIDASYMSAIGWKPQAASTSKNNESYGFGNTEMPSLRSFFSRLTTNATSSRVTKVAREEKAAQEVIAEDITKLSTATIFLRVNTAAIKTSVTSSFSAELERATKKPPPKIARLSILTSSYDETQASSKTDDTTAVAKATDVFASVLPGRKPGGRIFIGFPTTQTTGAGMHISAPSVIPTVEREAIDLNARWVRTWNIEMLRAAGIMTRLAFANEMDELHHKLQQALKASGASKFGTEIIAKHMPEAQHILKAFTFGDSTPSGHVSQIIEEAFWTSYKKPHIEVYSTQGVLPTTRVRLGTPELASFVDGIPIIPAGLEDIRFVQKLIDFALLSHITVDDVRMELADKPLDRGQLVNFVQWAGKKAVIGELDPASKDRLLDVAVAVISNGEGAQGDIIALGSIRNYLSPSKIPAGLPIPPTTIPLEFTVKCTINELQALGWEPLEVVPWLRYLFETRSSRSADLDLTQSAKFSIQILTVLSKGWDNMSQSSKATVVSLLQAHTVMPTKLGMRRPTESYFQFVKLFDDLPTIEGCSSLKDKFLTALEVRKTVDLDTIFKRLLNPTQDFGQARWSHVELIKYLASVQNDIPSNDLKKLMESKICPADGESPSSEESKPGARLYKVSELFEPQGPLRELEVKVLQWPAGGLRQGSPEAKFLTRLGLRPYPTAAELVDMMASSDLSLRDRAMNYFIKFHVTNNYSSFNIGTSTKAFLPIEGNPKKVAAPSACFSNANAAVLGFEILKRELLPHALKFGVATDPPIAECVARLLRGPPQNQSEATVFFTYFSTRLNELSDSLVLRLRDSPVVPVTRRSRVAGNGASAKDNGSNVQHLTPRNCYLGNSVVYGDIFDFVDFGSSANTFLYKCGSKTEPTKLEIAHLAAEEPAKLLSVLQSPDKYLNLLRFLAEDMTTLKRDKDLWKKMKVSQFLLAFKDVNQSSKEKETGAEEEEASIRHYQLAAAQQVVILDDYISYRLFKEHLICAPEEDKLESFYAALGCPTLSGIVQEDLKFGGVSQKQDGATWLQKHVLERAKLFIHEYSRHSPDAIKHDAKWLEKNLSVEVVHSIALRRSLRGLGQSHTEKRSAACKKGPNGYVLYVAAESSRPDMYQVGQAICMMILNRPGQQAYFFFEPFLKLDLLDLRARGYNVDRILRAKAAEARIIEEERRKALDEEQARIRQREQEFRQQTQGAPVPPVSRQQNKTPPPRMPGGFHDSPDNVHNSPDDLLHSARPPQPLPSAPAPKGKGIFQSFSKRFGFDTSSDAEESLNKFIDSGPKPAMLPPPEPSGSGSQSPPDGKVTSPAVVQQNLLNAIKSTRAHDSSQLFSPPTTQEVKEQATYCDDTAGKDLEFAAESSNSMRVFVSRDVTMSTAELLKTYHRDINAFAVLLREVGDIYSIPAASLHIFFDETGNTIAFNRDGSVFCNLRFYLQLHAAKIKSSGGRAEAAVYWWVVLAHELSHNIVKAHNSDHSFYTESFVQQYFPRMMAKVSEYTNSSAAPVPAGQSTASPPRGAPPPYQEALGGGR